MMRHRVGDLASEGRIDLQSPPECFTDDLELALYGRPQQRVLRVVLEGSAAREPQQKLARLHDVEQVLPYLKRPQRAPPA